MEKETLKEAAKNYAVNKSSSDVFRKAHAKDFIAGAKWMKEQMEKLKDFDTWKEWKKN
jgi:hypothetical protein